MFRKQKLIFGLSFSERPILGDQVIQEKLFSFMECSGKAMSQDFTWNLLDFTKSAGFHVKFAGFHEIRNERPTIARNGKAYVLPFEIIPETREFCQNEKFTGQCGRDEVIVMETAVYGRMKFSRCIERDYGYVVS